jgi:hypothetical protein
MQTVANNSTHSHTILSCHRVRIVNISILVRDAPALNCTQVHPTIFKQAQRQCACEALTCTQTIPISMITQIPQQTPTIAQIPQQTPIITQIPQQTPILTQIPQQTPIISQIPQQTPIITQIPQQTPIIVQIPQQTPIIQQIPQQTLMIVQINSVASHRIPINHIASNCLQQCSLTLNQFQYRNQMYSIAISIQSCSMTHHRTQSYRI